jgi:hypothetical protein
VGDFKRGMVKGFFTMAQINAHERLLNLSELYHSLGEIQTDDIVSTQNALIILVQLVREQAQEITVLKAEIEHLWNVAGLGNFWSIAC